MSENSNPVLETGTGDGDFVGLIIYRPEDGHLLVIDYKKPGRQAQVKFLGGCLADDEDPWQGLVNEIEQESDKVIRELKLVRHVATYHTDPGVHHKHFFVTSWTNLDGELRSTKMIDGDEELGVPRWVHPEGALAVLFPSHKKAFIEAIKVLGRMKDGDDEFRKLMRSYRATAHYLPER